MMKELKAKLSSTLILTVACVSPAAVVYLATFSRPNSDAAMACGLAVLVTLSACLPPQWVSPNVFKGGSFPLITMLWRFSIMLGGVLLLGKFEGEQRNCFMYSLLACYFVALPLESWLLVRTVRQTYTKLPLIIPKVDCSFSTALDVQRILFALLFLSFSNTASVSELSALARWFTYGF